MTKVTQTIETITCNPCGNEITTPPPRHEATLRTILHPSEHPSETHYDICPECILLVEAALQVGRAGYVHIPAPLDEQMMSKTITIAELREVLDSIPDDQTAVRLRVHDELYAVTSAGWNAGIDWLEIRSQ